MKYDNISPALFLRRPNRFIAHILHEGEEKISHVKNTGRCRELLIPGANVLVQRAAKPERKTEFDLISVYKGERLINMDSAAPNVVFGEFLGAGGLGAVPEIIRPECTHADSRFDFYFEMGGKAAFAEVKGVTLEDDNIARFPDAPTERGLRHLRGLITCAEEGFDAYAVFVVQMKGIKYFEPNWETHRDFGLTLRQAEKAGVKILVYDCLVEKDGLKIDAPIPYIL